MTADKDEIEARTISRRTLLAGGGAAALIAALGPDVVWPEGASAAPGPTTAGGAAALATSLVGMNLASLQSSPMIESPWVSYQGEWCAVFVSWLLRAVPGIGYQTYAFNCWAAASQVSDPAVGDIIYYEDPGHVGIVVGINPLRTVEGNVPGVHWSQSLVKTYSPPWKGGYVFSRPNYPGGGSTSPQQLRSPVSYDLIPSGSNPELHWLVNTDYLNANGTPIKVQLMGTVDWGLMYAAKYNSRALSTDEANQYFGLLSMILPRASSQITP